MATVTVELDMSGIGTEVTWTVPGGVDAVLVCATGGSIKMSDVTGMAEPFTIPTNEDIVMTAFMITGDTFYFTGRKPAKLGIIYHT